MNKLWSFLKSEYRVFITLLFVCSVFGGVFLFAGLNMEYFVLGLEIILFALFIFLVMEWFSYVKKEDMAKRIEELEIENKALQSKIIDERKDLEEYFLLWIHQIKTPITVCNLILGKPDADHRLREQMIYIEEYTNMAMNYLKLLERTSDMDIYEVDLDIIISSIVKKYSLIFIEKKILLDYTPTNAKVISDAKWLSIMLEQIISNALKYTKSGKISINFDNELLKLSIKDTGIGIPSKDIKKIFDRGYSGFNGRVNEKSSGLGLYMVGRIAQILNIKIEVYSKLNIGSEFNFIFK
ncbi:sensor histidine kinase [Lachnoanaerobaculum sp. Marseille-Q4761]|jgi:ATPase/histidine kinase/DNA gyrase B/HSP90 domain protein|uniref:sensor histidine kinase n=1 Tax=Lachnoanaerobaculum sp. Marseille-Q4761 TaxID=2819511 RepID=UPI001AA1C9D1|nr:sensor histidine kinase [Lachnoanaerobaculum sp. Marseille-Q4761]MBO1870492.1 sensor histidine kinase [Lachnoanaerobaculum sp. Marseille-Q4761]